MARSDSAGFHTRQLVTRVGTCRLVFPGDRDTGVSYCRLLFGDTMLKDDSFRTGRPACDSPICDCGIVIGREFKETKDALFQFLKTANRKV